VPVTQLALEISQLTLAPALAAAFAGDAVRADASRKTEAIVTPKVFFILDSLSLTLEFMARQDLVMAWPNHLPCGVNDLR
jgi:hypothetical protein